MEIDYMSEAYVPLSELAKELGMHRTHVKPFALKHGISITRIRTRAAGNQETLAVAETDADTLRQIRQQWIGHATHGDTNGKGWFYIVQPLPEIDESRVKLGFAGDVQQRLNSYRTICPTAIVVRSWPCRMTWEPCAIASVTRIECTQIGQELFHCDDLVSLIGRCNQFFALLPNPHE
jgi:hypothetical protein